MYGYGIADRINLVYSLTPKQDLALGHVRALEIPEAAQKRFFFTAGHFNNRQIAEAIRDNFPEFRDKLPTPEVAGGDFPKTGLLGYDNKQTIDILNIKFRSIQTCIIDSVLSFKHKI